MAHHTLKPIPWHDLAAAALLVLMAALLVASSWNDSATTDDVVTIGAGYSYLRRQELRFEPQNPPLIKDLAALPLLFLNLNEPWQHPSWSGTIEEQDPDQFGRQLLYHSGNDADRIARAARIPMVLFTMLCGAGLYWWTRRHWGASVALLAIVLFALSPTFLAHGRMMATDLGATAGYFFAVAAFLRFLRAPSCGNTLLAGMAMGFAFLTKFSTVALLPITLAMTALWSLAGDCQQPLWRNLLGWMARAGAVYAIAYLLIYPVYLFHIWNYDPAQQLASAQFHYTLYGMQGWAAELVVWASDKALLRPWAAYFLGLLAALQASHWGQPMFFLGVVRPTGVPSYFPVMYLLKEPLAVHLLTLAALAMAFSRLRWPAFDTAAVRQFISNHFLHLTFLLVLAVYWTALIRSHMNIGVRHLLPAFPFTFLLVAQCVVAWLENLRRPVAVRAGLLGLAVVLGWQAASVLRVHPSYLAYFNELAGGADGGWRYANDSNLDWGQDIKRLAQYVEAQQLPGIYADYFGPADATYYLREKYLGPVGCGELPKGWVAISAMLYTGAPWNPSCDYRQRLPMDRLVAKVGYSIFVFRVD